MSAEKTTTTTTGYRVYFLVFAAMLVLLAASVGLSKVDLGGFTVFALLAIALIQAVIVLAYSMHLKFDQKIYAVFVAIVFLVFTALVVITFFDYLYR